MEKRLYRLGVFIAVGLFLNAFVGLLHFVKDTATPAYAQGSSKGPTAVYLVDKSSGTPVSLTKRTYDTYILRVDSTR